MQGKGAVRRSWHFWPRACSPAARRTWRVRAGASAAPGPTTPEQRRLGNYANSFAVQGGVLGGLIGAALGCAVGAAVKGKEGCAYGAVAGSASVRWQVASAATC